MDPGASFLLLAGATGGFGPARPGSSGPPLIAGLPPRLVAASGNGVLNFALGTYGTGTHF